MARFMASLDMYRKVPADLLEGTRRGSILSLLAVFSMATLFFLETKSFLTTNMVTQLTLDRHKENKVMVTFNITMMDISCDHAVVDSVSVYGTSQTIVENIEKWSMDAEGVRQRYAGRNRYQRDIITRDESVTSTIEDLHEDGEDAISLDPETLEAAMKENEYLFVAFYSNTYFYWHEMIATWETLAELMNDVAANYSPESFKGRKKDSVEEELQENYEYSKEDYLEASKLKVPVTIAKFHCKESEEHYKICQDQQIMFYPTFRLFVKGVKHRGPRYGKEYYTNRTVLDFASYLAQVEFENHKQGSTLAELEKQAHARIDKPLDHQWRKERGVQHQWNDADHPGCQIVGSLYIDKTPGNFQISARSKFHELDSRWTNASHVVHHLSFTEFDYFGEVMEGRAFVPRGFADGLHPLDGNAYVTHHPHQAYQHHLKLVHSHVRGVHRDNDRFEVYQMLPQSQLSELPFGQVPEAKFYYDFSPVSVYYEKSGRKLYEYVTSLMAIVGGTFTVVGLMESAIRRVTASKKFQ